MCITASVGKKGANNATDAKVIQSALNLSIGQQKFNLKAELGVDGKVGKNTISAIELFQSLVLNMRSPDGRVDPNGRTLTALKSSLQRGITRNSLHAIMCSATDLRIKKFLPLLNQRLPGYGLNTGLRQAHYLAQVGHESLSFRYVEEIASGAAYEGRKDLGNIQKGDGMRFKGRGLIQLTGRDNYAAYGEHACLNLLKKGNEVMISSLPGLALDVSLWFWSTRQLNRSADRDDIKAITRRINGGYNGLADRQAYLNRAKFFLV